MNKVQDNVPTGNENASTLQCVFLKRSWQRTTLLVFFFIITGGVFYLPYRWLFSLRLKFYAVTTQEEATHISASKESLDCEIVPIISKNFYKDALIRDEEHKRKTFRTIEYRFELYYFEDEIGLFVPVSFAPKTSYLELHEMKNGLQSQTMIKHRLRIFGNSLIHVPVPSIFNSFINEVLKPFFVFQIFSVILWCTEEYYWYSIAIFVIMCVTMTVNIYYLQTNLKKIRAIAQHTCSVDVLRENARSVISSENLVPGDIVFVTKDLIFPCDLVLLKGYCLVDETMLTGESQPVMKESLPEIKMIYNREKLHTLSAGTRAVLFGDETIGLVTATGFKTAKGELVRSILFPTPNRFKFDRDALYFVGIMGLMALIGFFIAIEPLRKGGYLPGDIVKKLLDLVTIAVPPALPLTMTIGIGYSMGRLQDHNISCIRPPAVSSSGRVSVICFDKTGTLTQDKMSLNTVYDATLVSEKKDLKECDVEFQKCMAACHSLTLKDDILIGDPQEIAIIDALGWTKKQLDNGKIQLTSEDEKHTVQSIFTFHFNPEIKRMGVVVQSDSEILLYMKGAPEVIFPLCKDLPSDIHTELLKYTREGYRVLACAYKILPRFSKEMTLDDIEGNLHLLGMPLLENPVKDDARDTIETLLGVNITCVISTGDNYLTGLSVGRKIGLVTQETVYLGDYVGLDIIWEDHDGKHVEKLPGNDEAFDLVITGNLLEKVLTEETGFAQIIKERCKVFGRMTPKHKIMLIESFQLGETMVAMVGDGANDCGALKAADVGLSLSEAEASIAAPFCAKDLNKIIYILREGRCALATSFQCFRFMFMYSVIQFTCAVCLYWQQNNLTNNQYIYQDVFTVLPLTFTMAASKPYYRLSKRLPPGSLISIPIVTSILGHTLLAVLLIVAGLLSVQSLDWYSSPLEPGIDLPTASTEGNVIFMQGTAQLIILGIVFSIGKPFREAIYHNYPFCISILCLFICNLILIFSRSDFTYKFVDELDDGQKDYMWIVFGIMVGGGIIAYVYELWITPAIGHLLRKCFYRNR